MTENLFKRPRQTGRLLIEVLAVICIMMMFSLMMYKKQNERHNEIGDIAVAEQMRSLLTSVKAFVERHRADIEEGSDNDSSRTWCTGSLAQGCTFLLTDPNNGIREYLPQSVDLANPFYQDFRVSVRRADPVAVSTTDSQNIRPVQIVMVSGNMLGNRPLDNMRAAGLASMIGAAGGFIRDDSDPATGAATGNQGVWNLDTATYFQNEAPPEPVRIVMSADFDLQHGMFGSLRPYFDFNAGKPGNRPNSIGMMGDLLFNKDADQVVHFGKDGHTTVMGVRDRDRNSGWDPKYNDNTSSDRLGFIGTNSAKLDKITPYGDVVFNTEYEIDITSTGRIFNKTITAWNDPGYPLDPDKKAKIEAKGNIEATGPVRARSFFLRDPVDMNVYEIITQGRDIKNVRNITAEGQITSRTLNITTTGGGQVTMNRELGGALDNTNEGQIKATGNIISTQPIIANASSVTPSSIIGAINSTRKVSNFRDILPSTPAKFGVNQGDYTKSNFNVDIVGGSGVGGPFFGAETNGLAFKPEDPCKPGEIAQWGDESGNTLTCYNGKFTRSHPLYECPSGTIVSSVGNIARCVDNLTGAYRSDPKIIGRTPISTVLPTPTCQYGGIYPNCETGFACPAGYTGIYPNCVPPGQPMQCYCPPGLGFTLEDTNKCRRRYNAISTTTQCAYGDHYNGNACEKTYPGQPYKITCDCTDTAICDSTQTAYVDYDEEGENGQTITYCASASCGGSTAVCVNSRTGETETQNSNQSCAERSAAEEFNVSPNQSIRKYKQVGSITALGQMLYTNYYCPAYSYTAVDSVLCESGGSPSGSNMCAMKYAAAVNNYVCPNGGTLSSGRCIITIDAACDSDN